MSTYTEEEVARLQESEVQIVLKGLVRTLEALLAQREQGRYSSMNPRVLARRQGEIWGLKVALAAVKRRIR